MKIVCVCLCLLFVCQGYGCNFEFKDALTGYINIKASITNRVMIQKDRIGMFTNVFDIVFVQ